MHKVLSKSSLDFGQRPSAAYRQMASWTGDLLDKRIVLFLWSKLLLENIAPTVYQNINYKDWTDDRNNFTDADFARDNLGHSTTGILILEN